MLPIDDYTGKPSDEDGLDEDGLDRIKHKLNDLEAQVERIDDGLDRIGRKLDQMPDALEEKFNQLEGLFE